MSIVYEHMSSMLKWFLNKINWNHLLENGIWNATAVFLSHHFIISVRSDGKENFPSPHFGVSPQFHLHFFFKLKWPFLLLFDVISAFLLLTLFSFGKSTFQLRPRDFCAWIFYGMWTCCIIDVWTYGSRPKEIIRSRIQAKKSDKI